MRNLQRLRIFFIGLFRINIGFSRPISRKSSSRQSFLLASPYQGCGG